MKKTTLLILCSLIASLGYLRAASFIANQADFPMTIYSGKQGRFHVQGIVVDKEKGFVYMSFTTRLIKTDLNGNLIGSVEGLTGHLGCLSLNPMDGRVYGSLEYKNDGIGKGILKGLGEKESKNFKSGFYIAIFDVDKIVRPDMSAEKDQIMTTVYLPTVVDDYYARVHNKGKEVKHRYGCSGIDGVAFVPSQTKGQWDLYVAYGIYGDTSRTDNDYQVLLSYDVRKWAIYERAISQESIHTSGPKAPKRRYFVYTGNTSFGIQNLCYDAYTGNLLAAVYKGKKKEFPNYSLFAIHVGSKAQKMRLKGFDSKEHGWVLPLQEKGQKDAASGVYGWHFNVGSTGITSLGDGYFYISHPGVTNDDKQQYTNLRLYKWTGDANEPFLRLDKSE